MMFVKTILVLSLAAFALATPVAEAIDPDNPKVGHGHLIDNPQ